VATSVLALVAASCGGGEASAPEARNGPSVELALGASDFAVGENRIPFAVIRPNGELVQTPRARLLVAPGVDRPAEVNVTAELVPLGPHSHPAPTEAHDHADVTDLYVAHVRFRRPGRYVLVAEPENEEIRAVGEITVKRRSASPAIGSKAIRSDTPTLADAPATEITTARPPDTELLRVSVNDALAARAPFVLAFATPRFCQSRTCGPTVEVVDKVRQTFGGSPIRFIHVEVYEGNDPNNGVNRWMREWKLPSEPWVFLVDRDGIIRAKFEGSVSEAELEQAVREHLAG
jgi:hypothetical protein